MKTLIEKKNSQIKELRSKVTEGDGDNYLKEWTSKSFKTLPVVRFMFLAKSIFILKRLFLIIVISEWIETLFGQIG